MGSRDLDEFPSDAKQNNKIRKFGDQYTNHTYHLSNLKFIGCLIFRGPLQTLLMKCSRHCIPIF